MSNLPVDVLYVIFPLSIDNNPISGPINLSHCCRHWRNVALGAQILWANVLIKQPKSQYLDRLKTWLERSGEHPLNIHIQQSAISSDGFDQYLGTSIATLQDHTNRWAELTIKVFKPRRMNARLFAQCYLPKLSKVSLYFANYLFERDVYWGVLDIVAPKLQELEVCGQIVADRPDWWSTPIMAQGLRRFSIEYNTYGALTLEAYLEVIRQCPLLEQITVQVKLATPAHEPGIHTIQPHQVHAPHLRSILFHNSIDDALPFFTCIHAPNLTSLAHYIPFSFIPAIIRLPTFPFPALNSLCLNSNLYADPAPVDVLFSADFGMFLSHLSMLSSLELQSVECWESENGSLSFMEALTMSCPALECLTLTRCGGNEMAGALCALIEGRRQPSSGVLQLTTLKIDKQSYHFLAGRKSWLTENVDNIVLSDK